MNLLSFAFKKKKEKKKKKALSCQASCILYFCSQTLVWKLGPTQLYSYSKESKDNIEEGLQCCKNLQTMVGEVLQALTGAHVPSTPFVGPALFSFFFGIK
jgi:hypothetical protein